MFNGQFFFLQIAGNNHCAPRIPYLFTREPCPHFVRENAKTASCAQIFEYVNRILAHASLWDSRSYSLRIRAFPLDRLLYSPLLAFFLSLLPDNDGRATACQLARRSSMKIASYPALPCFFFSCRIALTARTYEMRTRECTWTCVDNVCYANLSSSKEETTQKSMNIKYKTFFSRHLNANPIRIENDRFLASNQFFLEIFLLGDEITSWSKNDKI